MNRRHFLKFLSAFAALPLVGWGRRKPTPKHLMIATPPTSGVVGGINQSSSRFWNSQTLPNTALTDAEIIQTMNELYELTKDSEPVIFGYVDVCRYTKNK